MTVVSLDMAYRPFRDIPLLYKHNRGGRQWRKRGLEDHDGIRRAASYCRDAAVVLMLAPAQIRRRIALGGETR
jgi:hypothetical protein